MNKIGICELCGKEKTIFYYNMCQTCYRKFTKEKKENTAYIRIGKNKNIIVNEILDLFLNKKLTRKQIHKIINEKYGKCIYRYINKVIEQNTLKIEKWRLKNEKR